MKCFLVVVGIKDDKFENVAKVQVALINIICKLNTEPTLWLNFNISVMFL